MKGFGEFQKIKKVNGNIKQNKLLQEEIIDKAIRFHLKGNINEAYKLYQKCIKFGSLDPYLFSNYGIILKGLGKLKESEQALRKAIKLKPEFPEAYSNLGSVLRDIGSLGESEKALRKAIELKPELPEAHFNLGNVLRDIGSLSESEKAFLKAIDLNPEYAEAFSNLGNVLREIGNPTKAEKVLNKAIKLNPKFATSYFNLSNVFRDLGKLQESEKALRKAIDLNPQYAKAYSNLGNLLRDLGNLQESEKALLKAIDLNPQFAKAYYSLSIFRASEETKIVYEKLFSEEILHNKTDEEKIDIYFARANFLHQEKKYEGSTNFLDLANNLQKKIKASNLDSIIQKSQYLLEISERQNMNTIEKINLPETIFIVGMPRSGSTLLESILDMNEDVFGLGETTILDDLFQKIEESNNLSNLAEQYTIKSQELSKNKKITINKNLYNYQYAGIISKYITNAKIINCVRNPLDNILSIYRANFAKGHGYASCLQDCSKLFLHQEELIKRYKKIYPSKIYSLDYDLLVNNPIKEIKSLINWLAWKWDEKYLLHHQNKRPIFTASSIQARFPINSKSVGGWKNYENMLKPAIQILGNINF
tara:strand:- start:897 stop:2672 length:1776 start_codon:yes stop_codon:yes gene_type:complete